MELDEYASLSRQEIVSRGEEIEKAVENKMLERTALEWDEIFSQAGVVGGGVRNLAEVLATGQPSARELISTVSSAAGDFKVTNNGYRINDEVFTPSSGVPTLGQHTLEVLDEFGYDMAKIDSLKEKGIIKG
jgi:formyl-CoA transferase